jgi:hypothetical protein
VLIQTDRQKRKKNATVNSHFSAKFTGPFLNPLNAELNPIRHLLAQAGAHHFVNVSRIRVNYSELGFMFSPFTPLNVLIFQNFFSEHLFLFLMVD